MEYILTHFRSIIIKLDIILMMTFCVNLFSVFL